MIKSKKQSIKPLVSAICLIIGSSLMPSTAQAEVFTFTFGSGISLPVDLNSPNVNDSLFTLGDSFGNNIINISLPYYYDSTWGYGRRTQISGSFTLDTNSMSGTATILPFDFFDRGAMTFSTLTLSDAGLDPVTGNQLILGQGRYNWNVSTNIPFEIVWDISGLMNAVTTGITIGDIITGGALPADNTIRKQYLIGPAPIATTSWNTNIDGSLPLTDDGISGSPLRSGPFVDTNPSFDIRRLVVGQGNEFLSIVIDSSQGDVAECNSYDGSTVRYTATIQGDNNDPVTNIEWTVDNSVVANGLTVDLTLPLGTHSIRAVASTAADRSANDSDTILVKDTVKPKITANLVDSKTGEIVSTVETGHAVQLQMEATDACDSDPQVTATAGFSVEPNARFKAIKKGHHARAKIVLASPTDNIEFAIIAKDSSGNTSFENLSLNVVPKAKH